MHLLHKTQRDLRVNPEHELHCLATLVSSEWLECYGLKVVHRSAAKRLESKVGVIRLLKKGGDSEEDPALWAVKVELEDGSQILSRKYLSCRTQAPRKASCSRA